MLCVVGFGGAVKLIKLKNMELKLGTKCTLKHLTSKDSDEGVLGKIINYASELGGRVYFATPHGTIIETGILWLKPLQEKEKIKLEELELDALKKNGCLYGEEVIY